jgi:hypothetical protein
MKFRSPAQHHARSRPRKCSTGDAELFLPLAEVPQRRGTILNNGGGGSQHGSTPFGAFARCLGREEVAGLIGSPARISAGRVDGQVADSVGRLCELHADSFPGRALSAGTKRLTTWVPRA